MLTVECCLGNFCANVLFLSPFLLFLKCHANNADDAFQGLSTSFKEKDICENEMVMCVHRIRKKEKVFSTCVLLSKLNLHL